MRASVSDVCDCAKSYHLGKMFVHSVKKYPGIPNQIDGFTSESETNGSVLERTLKLAICFKNYGLKPGDVIALAGRNHLDLQIPHYAGLLEGLPVAGVDPTYKYEEIRNLFELVRPSIVFCENGIYEFVLTASSALSLPYKIIAFDGYYNLQTFIDDYVGRDENLTLDNYEPVDFDPAIQYAWLVSTSGTTGTPKTAAFTHQVIAENIYILRDIVKPAHDTMSLNLSPPQWISSFFNALINPIYNVANLQTSGPNTVEHIVEIINKYKPTSTMFSPMILRQILKYPGHCDLSHFKSITVTGSKVYRELYRELKVRTRSIILNELYGLTETLGPVLLPDKHTQLGSCGKPYSRFQVKLRDSETHAEILQTYRFGELLVKGPTFSEYYRKPLMTANAFTEDGWFKTGDMFYRNERNNYFFVERLPMLIKCRNYHELEEAIRQIPEVEDVAVIGLPDPYFTEVPAALVVKREGTTITTDYIKYIVESKFTKAKKLRGGVAFVPSLPMTSTGKIARQRLHEVLATANIK